MNNYYKILGIDENATIQEIKKAYITKKMQQKELLASEDEGSRQSAKREILRLQKAYKEIMLSRGLEPNSKKEATSKSANKINTRRVNINKKPTVKKYDMQQIVMIVLAVIVLISLGGLGYHFFGSRFLKNDLDGAQGGAAKVVQKSAKDIVKSINNIGQALPGQNKVENMSKPGTIIGDEVSLRSVPSTSGSKISVLYKDTPVTIVEKQECNDKRAAILDISSKTFTYDGNSFTIQNGQALQVVDGDPLRDNVLRCKVELQNGTAYLSIDKRDIRMLLGNVWYRVSLANGQTGYVFGKYVREL